MVTGYVYARVLVCLANTVAVVLVHSTALGQPLSDKAKSIALNHPPVSVPPAKVQAFLNAHKIGDGGVVCSAAFKAIANSSKPLLIASVDYSGRQFCNDVIVADQSGSKYIWSSVDVWQVNDIVPWFVRLDPANREYLVLPMAISDYDGIGCVAVVPSIFIWRDGKLINSSRAFPAFFANELHARFTERGSGRKASGSMCETMERDKLRRLSGYPQAGYAVAMAWMNSADAKVRMKAVRIFADIADEASKDRLQTLARDQSTPVAVEAQGYLQNMH